MTKETNVYTGLNDDQKAAQIPFYLHENEMYRVERLNKRWFISFLIVLAMLFVTNAGWIIYEMQYETYYIQQDAEAEGDAMLNATGRMVIYGDQGQTDGEGSGEANEQEEPDQAMPDM